MYPDILLWLSASTQLLLVVLGAAVALKEGWAKKHPWMLLAAFFLLGAVGEWATFKTSKESAQANAELSNSLENLRNAANEISRVESLNTRLQQELLDSSETIASLSKQNMNTMTGGDSFCYLVFSQDGSIMTFVQKGDYPLYDVTARVTDLRRYNQLFTQSSHPNFQDLSSASTNMSIGNLAARSANTSATTIPFSDSQREDLNIFFSGRNGFWTQLLRLRKIGGKWVGATKVLRNTTTPAGNGVRINDVKIFEQVDKDFPRNKGGGVDWD